MIPITARLLSLPRLAAAAILLTLAVAAPARAQITDPATQRLGVDVVDDGRGPVTSFELTIDGQAQPATLPTPTGATYAFAVPASIVDGSHTATIRACRATATPTCGNTLTLAFTVQRPIPPPTLQNFRVITTATVRNGVQESTLVRVEPLPPPQ